MSGARITRGPWLTRAGATAGVEIVGKRPRGGDYVVARCGGEDREANGCLLAAAPELLDMLREARLFVQAQGDVFERIDAVIAKAEGR